MSTVDPRIAAIERDRKAKKISHGKLCQLSRVHPSTWFYLRRGDQRPKSATIARLNAALIGRDTAVRLDHALVAAAHRLIVASLARAGGDDPLAVLEQDFSAERPRDPLWLRASELRRQAMYVLGVELMVPNATLGRAIGCSRQNIKQARDQVEDHREADTVLNALLDELAAVVRPKGRAE